MRTVIFRRAGICRCRRWGGQSFCPPARETPLFVYCLSGVRSRQAAGLLRRMGYTDVTDLGGICNYRGKVVK